MIITRVTKSMVMMEEMLQVIRRKTAHQVYGKKSGMQRYSVWMSSADSKYFKSSRIFGEVRDYNF
jgi:hypothetical protein